MYKPKTETDDLKMMADDTRWPLWPRLPIKRTVDGKQQFAVLAFGVTRDGQRVIYHANAFDKWKPETPHTIYDSHEAILADGWRVD